MGDIELFAPAQLGRAGTDGEARQHVESVVGNAGIQSLWHGRISHVLPVDRNTPADRFESLTALVEYLRFVESIMQQRYEVGSLQKHIWHECRYHRIDAEIRLLKAKEAMPK